MLSLGSLFDSGNAVFVGSPEVGRVVHTSFCRAEQFPAAEYVRGHLWGAGPCWSPRCPASRLPPSASAENVLTAEGGQRRPVLGSSSRLLCVCHCRQALLGCMVGTLADQFLKLVGPKVEI